MVPGLKLWRQDSQEEKTTFFTQSNPSSHLMLFLSSLSTLVCLPRLDLAMSLIYALSYFLESFFDIGLFFNDFFSKNVYFLRCFNSKTHTIMFNVNNFDYNIVTNHNLLLFLP